ncbi:MAG: hypothetical protein ACR2MU_06680 [Gaiellaceae bacterium]
MVRRLLPLALVAATALADGAGFHRLGFYLLLAAIPACCAEALSSFGDALDEGERNDGLQTVLVTLALALLVLGAADRAPHLVDGALPALGLSALVGALAALVLQIVTGLVAAVPVAAFRSR